MQIPIEWAFAGANTALLTGIFFKLGAIGAGLAGLKERVTKLEGKSEC